MVDLLRLFERDGYVKVKNFLSSEEVEELLQECNKIMDEMDPSEHHSIFQTGTDQVGDNYFLNSGDKISFFFEKQAFDEDGKLVVEKHKALNKIGHALHWLSPAFKRVTFSEKVKELLKALKYKEPVVAQSMYIFKHPEIGCEVVPHQDSTYLYTEPPTALGLWFPLIDVTDENGCLRFIPGSHEGPLYQRFERNPGGHPLLLLKGSPIPTVQNEYVSVLAKAGDCVIIHGTVIHMSARNHTSQSRPIYTFHVVEKDAQYSPLNWLQPSKELPFPSVYTTEV